jgi:hypothetical protein
VPTLGTRLLAAAVVTAGLGSALWAADAPPDLADLRDAVKAAARRGQNVGEVAAAVDALEKSLAKGFVAPKPGGTVPPPAELTAVRDAVEAAARKGENVEAIRTELEAVEKAVTGRVLDRPKPPAPPADPPVRPRPELPFNPGAFPRPVPFPAFPNGGGRFNPEDLQKAQAEMLKALELMMQNMGDADARKQLEMLKALAGQGGLPNFPAFPGLDLPDLNGRAPAKFRLGVRLEKLSPVVVEQLGLEAGRGVTLTEVVEGSPAEKAGFRANDIVLEFAGKPVTDVPEEFTRQVNEAKAGKVDAVVLRRGKKVELKGIELGDPQPAPPRRLNVRPAPALPALPGLNGLPGANGRGGN